MAKIIAVVNQKGGVGKTTTSVNLAAALSLTKRKVLLVDLDPQGNATMGSGTNKYEVELTGYEVLLNEAPIRDALVITETVGYHLLAGSGDLTVAEVHLMSEEGRELRLKQALAEIEDEYDYIIIDCPPSLSLLTINALTAAHGVLVPIQCEYYALEGLTALLDTIEQVRSGINPDLRLQGLLRTMFDARNNLANQVSEQLLQHFGDQVYRTIIPRNVRLAEAPSHGVPILDYDKGSRGAVAYLALAGEVLRREEGVQQAAGVE